MPASNPHSPGGPVFTGTHPSTYNPPHPSASKTNAWCAWGFGLGLAGLPFLICGVGVFMAIAGLVMGLAVQAVAGAATLGPAVFFDYLAAMPNITGIVTEHEAAA